MYVTTYFAKRVMSLFPVYPRFEAPGLGERIRFDPSKADQEAEFSYHDEQQYPIDNYFGFGLPLASLEVLDLGCYCGGKAVAWAERYGVRKICGIDMLPTMIDAASRFASKHQVEAEFRVGFAESMPFPDNRFDAVVSFDVLEHVRDVAKVLSECYRVLRPGGRAYLIFPPYFHPTEHHLGLVSRTPCVHYLFSGKTLARAHSEMIQQRNEYWYYRPPELQPWERCHTINGTGVRTFDKLMKRSGFVSICRVDPPLFSVGRNASKMRVAKAAAILCRSLQLIPFTKEISTHRIVRVLEKPGSITTHCTELQN